METELSQSVIELLLLASEISKGNTVIDHARSAEIKRLAITAGKEIETLVTLLQEIALVTHDTNAGQQITKFVTTFLSVWPLLCSHTDFIMLLHRTRRRSRKMEVWNEWG